MDVTERYRNDPLFHCFVDSMRIAIDDLILTPTEVREAAMLACIMHEQSRPFPRSFLLKDEIVLKNLEPCGHPGCEKHLTHPCERCGRIGARGVAVLVGRK